MKRIPKTGRAAALAAVDTVVIKIGSQVYMRDDGSFDNRRLAALAGEISTLRGRGIRVVVVSSGAIAMGMEILGVAKRPTELVRLQALAALGQARLLEAYRRAFVKSGVNPAQILLTRDDFDDRSRYLNARGTIFELLDEGIVPVVNENDTVATEEICFGDNDMLSALVSNMIRADLLLILTVVDGLYRVADDKNSLVGIVEKIDANVQAALTNTKSRLGTGGMASKIAAIGLVTKSGEPAIIANGKRKNVIADIFDGKPVGTLFLGDVRKLSSRGRYLGTALRPAGAVTVDAGAERAILVANKSLLAAGIVRVAGAFEKGELVKIKNLAGAEIARGLVGFSASDLFRVMGKKSEEIAAILGPENQRPAVHRNNLVISGS